MLEPGLDEHEWESQWQQFEEDVETSPAEALPELDRLIGEMLEARGYAIGDPVVSSGDDRDIVAEFLAAREITRQIEKGADDDPGDIAAAIDGYRLLHDYLHRRTRPSVVSASLGTQSAPMRGRCADIVDSEGGG